ncbi:hypothetical protein [Dongia sp. agr-C8]
MARRRFSRRRGGSETLALKAIAIAIVVAVLLGLGGVFWYVQGRAAQLAALDPETLCPKSGPTSQFAVLVDRTDALTEIQGEALRRQITAWAAAIPKHGSFKVYEVGYGGALLQPVVAVCNPGDGSDQSAIDSNPKMWRARYEEKFQAPIAAMLERMRLDEEAKASPILEGVQAIAVKDFGPDAPQGPKTLIIVSDLLQNQPGFSLYQSVPPLDAFWATPYAASVRSNLTGIHTEIHLLHRLKAAAKQTDALGKFWIDWLQRQGAEVDAFRSVPG